MTTTPAQRDWWQIDAANAAWTQESYSTVQRHIGVGLALDAILAGERRRSRAGRGALSVERQARILGLGTIHLEVPA